MEPFPEKNSKTSFLSLAPFIVKMEFEIYKYFPQFFVIEKYLILLQMGKNLAVCPSLTPSFVLYKQNQESYDSKQFVPTSA